jgi:hypothetical protein
MNKGLLFGLTALAVATAATVAFFPKGQNDAPTPEPLGSASPLPPTASYYEAYGDPLWPLWLCPEVYGSISLTKENTLLHKLAINDPRTETGRLSLEQFIEIEVPYKVLTVNAGLGPHAFVVHGETEDGLQVLEQFRFTPSEGAYKFESVAPLGSIRASIQGGGPFLPPDQRIIIPPGRTLLYLNPALGSNLCVANGSEGRFTYVVSVGQNLLTRIPWELGLSPTSIPLGDNQELLSQVDYAQVYTHRTEGDKLKLRLWDSKTGMTTGYLLCSDKDSAGVFASSEFLTKDEYKATGYPGLWADDHISHLSWLPIY